MRVVIWASQREEVADAVAIAAARGATVAHEREREGLLARLRSGSSVDLVLVEIGAGVRDASELGALASALASERFLAPIVACGVDVDPREAVAAIHAGAREFLPLPPEPELIAAMLEMVAERPDGPICADPKMEETLALARQFAPSDASVLVHGESGVGKEVVARYLHAHSRRAERAFVSLNCAAIPDQLLESELFGHEKGAFTGAVARRIGKFEEADGGTLLLDEVTEMDARLQAKLLRAIQEREIDRVGGSKPVKVDIRLIATTNRDLERAVADGAFREDLYFRLNVLALRVPPLRERRKDVAALAEHFARKHARNDGQPDKPISKAALAKLEGHGWRGNVRELDNVIHRAVLLARGPSIEADDIALGGPGETPRGDARASRNDEVGRTIAAVEQDLIIDTLRKTAGNRTHAATMLGISIRTLRNKLKLYSSQGVAVPPPQADVGG